MKLISQNTLEHHFLDLMQRYTRYYWAMAWAGATSACFDALKDNKDKIGKIVVGTHFYQTHPDFIEEFRRSRSVRFVSRTDELFHPKIYLFEQSKKSNKDWALLIGSPNFTASAFGKNTEAAILIRADDDPSNKLRNDARKLIEDSWQGAKRFEAQNLVDYRALWERHKPKRDAIANHFGNKPGRKPLHESPVGTMAWRKFYRRVVVDERQCAERLRVLEITTDLFRGCEKTGKGFNTLSEIERKAIAGTLGLQESEKHYKVDIGYFGNMRAKGTFKHEVMAGNIHLARAVDAIPASGEVRSEHYRDFVKQFEQVPKQTSKEIPLATGTRLLAMKRPDLFVCFNTANKANLCKDFGITVTKMTFERYWDEIIARIVNSVWWNSAPPANEQEHKVWRGRSAFLDALYY